MKKKLYLVLVCAALSLTCFLFGCEKGSSSSESGNLVGYVDETATVAYGSAYVLETTVRDDVGTIYEATYTVKDSSGAQVEVERGKFLALDKSGYTVTYVVTTPKSTYTRTVTLTVVNGYAPAIEMTETKTVYMFGESFTVPAISVYDYFDGEITEYTVEFFRKTETSDEKYDYEYSPDTLFQLTKSGDHYMKVTARNSAGKVAEARKEFLVRDEMLPGEYDCFSDIGCLSTTTNMAAVSARNWHETYKGRQGVLSFNVSDTKDAFRMMIHADAKADQSAYEDYEYLAVTMYIEAEEGAITDLRLFPADVGDFKLEDIAYNCWKTYYFPNKLSWAVKSMNMCGATVSPATVYIDGIFFGNSVDLSGEITEENDLVTIDYGADGVTMDYAVYFGNELISASGNTFTPSYYGEYTIYPTVLTPIDRIYTGSAITYAVTGAELRFNAYDETVENETTSYVAPEATVYGANDEELTGFTITYQLSFTDYAGNTVRNGTFDASKKGVYTYFFTAEKDGRKVLGEASVKTGSYLEGEVFNVSDTDATLRTGALGTTGDVTVVDGEEIDAAYAANRYLSFACAADQTYVNFAPSAKLDAVMSAYDEIRMSVYPKVTPTDGATTPEIKLTFLGTAFTLTANTMNEISVSLLTPEAVSEYAKLGKTATATAYALLLETTVSDCDSFTLYVGDVTAATGSLSEVKLLSVESANDMPRFGADWVYREKSYFDAYTIAGDYTGGAATKYNQTDVSVRLDMTKDELALFKSKYNAVKFNLMLFHSSLNPASEVNFTNFALVTYTQAVWNFNTWYEITVGIDDVIAAMSGDELKLVVGAAKIGASPTFCFGDIELANVTDTFDPVLVTPSAECASYFTNSKSTDSLNSPVSGTYNETLGQIALPYDGNPGAANAIFLSLNQSAEELQAISERYGYTQIKFTFRVNAAETNTSGKITFSGLFGTQKFAGSATDGYLNYRENYEFTVSVDDVVAAMNACTLKQNTFLLMQVDERTGGSPTGFSFGTVEFVS